MAADHQFPTHLPTHEKMPKEYAGKPIGFRIPHDMPGELLLANGASGIPFPEATFLHTRDKPFEIHRMIIRIFPFDDASPAAALPPPFVGAVPDLLRLLQHYVRLNMADTSKNERMTRNNALVNTLLKENEQTWEWEEPYTIVRGEGFEITLDSLLAAFGITVGATTITVGNLRVEISFEGFLIVVAPASETR